MSDLKKEFAEAQAAFDPDNGPSVARWQAVIDRVYSSGLKLGGGPGVKTLFIDDGAKPVTDAKPVRAPRVEIRDIKKDDDTKKVDAE